MPEPLVPALARIRSLVLDDHALVRAIGAGRRRGGQPSRRRVELRYVDLRAGRRLQVTTYDETTAHTRNVELADAAAVVDEMLAEPFGNWHVDAVGETVQLRVTKKGEAQVHVSARETTPEAAEPPRAHDRAKRRLLDPADPFLAAVGIATADGKVKPSRVGKYRQVEEFVRLAVPAIDDALSAGHLPSPTADRPLRLVDLGCGNAYLTFAAYRYLAQLRGLPTVVTGVDVRRRARERNSEIAQQLGWAEAVTFVAGEIETAPVAEPPDVVLALHACDTATDDALARAVRWRAPLILAAPCCHHDLQAQLAHRSTPAPYGLLTRHGILRERLADVLTDAFRAAVLRLLGYRVDVVEFVPSEHTPRNLLLRATRTGAAPTAELWRDYRDLVTAWNVEPALARRLGDDVGRVGEVVGG